MILISLDTLVKFNEIAAPSSVICENLYLRKEFLTPSQKILNCLKTIVNDPSCKVYVMTKLIHDVFESWFSKVVLNSGLN